MAAVQTTWANVLAIAPELSNVPSLATPANQNIFLADANQLMNAAVWGDQFEMGQRFLTAHLASLSLFTSRGIGVGGIRSPGGGQPNDYSATVYGTRYQLLQRQLPAARLAIAAPTYATPPPIGTDDSVFG